jgi:hypothetical protein
MDPAERGVFLGRGTMSGKRVFDIADALGAQPQGSFQRISVYVADRDKDNKPVDVDAFIEAIMHLLAKNAGGVTRLPWSQGKFKVFPTDKTTGATLIDPSTGVPAEPYYTSEKTAILYSFVFDPDEFERQIDSLKLLLHDYGYSTNQAAVMFEYSGEIPGGGSYMRAYLITEYVTP